MEELKDGVKKVGTEVKTKVKKKAHAASEFVKGVQEKEYKISGDAVIGSGLALSGILIAAAGKILKLIAAISEKIGEINAKYLIKTNPTLRKQNQIKTIHSSLSIEGNTLSEEQITAILENKRVVGPEKDILEVLNALDVYKNINKLKPTNEKDFLKAHKLLLQKLIEKLHVDSNDFDSQV